MIKKLILWFFVVWFSFISYSFANSFVQIWSSTYLENAYDSTYQNLVMKWWRFVTTNLWTSKDLFWFWNKNFVFWNNSGLYLYDFYWATSQWIYDCPARLVQWYFNQYRVCPVIWSWEFSINSCWSPLDYSSDIVWNFLNSLVKWDWFYYDHSFSNESYCRWFWYSSTFCFSSSSIWSTMCFTVSHDPEWSAWWNNPFVWLSWSLWLSSDVSFSNIDYSLLNYPPKYSFDGLGIEWESNTSVNVWLSWNLLYNSCTNWYILTQLDKSFPNYRYLCQAWIFDTWIVLDNSSILSLNPVPWQGVDFKTIYSLTNDWLSWNKWFQKYSSMFYQYKYHTNVYASNPFYWQNALLWSYFHIIDQYWYLDNYWYYSYDILNACKLLLYSDWDSEYKWSYFSSQCSKLNYGWWSSNITTWEIWNVEDDHEVLPPWFDTTPPDDSVTSSWVVISVDWSWTLSWNTNENFDWKDFINKFYQKLQSRFQKPINNLVWIIPWYILVFMFSLILFRFLAR